MSASPTVPPVLILGAGINGCALARELALNGVAVVLVDRADLATGATAKSSRLIHGGLRYLEHGDFRLVAESLRERERLLKLAPQFVRPLKLSIPVARRFGGLLPSAWRFLQLGRFAPGRTVAALLPGHSGRGLYVVRIGLWIYDRIARSSRLPGHQVRRVGEAGAPAVDLAAYRWVCDYYDAQMLYPERFVVALLEDARCAARESGADLQVLTYHHVELRGGIALVRPVEGGASHQFAVSAVVNATGAWGDLTLRQLDVREEPLFGGTRGSHFITTHARLRESLGEGGVYAEAADGRLVFILPFAGSVLVGTTDERFDGPPDQAVASEHELSYLIAMVNEVFPQVRLVRNDVLLHYCGVRPLPHVPSGRPGAIPRGHSIHTGEKDGIRVLTLIGGKLTTCRAFAEEAADELFRHLGVRRRRDTRERLVPGAENYPEDPASWCDALSCETGLSAEQVNAVFQLLGTRAAPLLRSHSRMAARSIPGTLLPIAVVDHIISTEWVSKLSDLIERRLMLVFAPGLSLHTLQVLADRLCHGGVLSQDERAQSIEESRARLRDHYGVVIGPSDGNAEG